jgi:hypothetical protein
MSTRITKVFRARTTYLVLLAICVLMLPSQASPLGEIFVYSTDFSTDPHWSTNNPATNYYDPAMGAFHYLMRDGSGAYVNVKVPYDGESFTLAFDILPQRTDYQASVKFGLGDDDQVTNQRLTMFTEFENGPYGRLIWIRSIDGQNQRREASSYYLSYGRPTVQFTDGIWYHVAMDYRVDSRSLSISVIRRNDSVNVWQYTVDTVSIFPTMNRIYMSKIGDSTNPNAIAEGYIDNVAFSLIPAAITPQPAGPQAAPGTPGSAPATAAQTTAAPTAQSPQAPRPVPVSVPTLLGALAVSIAWMGIRRAGKL